jgi:hypothetical protein
MREEDAKSKNQNQQDDDRDFHAQRRVIMLEFDGVFLFFGEQFD